MNRRFISIFTLTDEKILGLSYFNRVSAFNRAMEQITQDPYPPHGVHRHIVIELDDRRDATSRIALHDDQEPPVLYIHWAMRKHFLKLRSSREAPQEIRAQLRAIFEHLQTTNRISHTLLRKVNDALEGMVLEEV